MNFNFKFSNYQNLYIFFLLFALIKIFFSTGNLYAKGFNINNVEISTKFEINFNRDYVLDEGFDLSFNKLIRQAKGEYIAFMDSDDISIKKRLEYQLNYLLTNNLDALINFTFNLYFFLKI